MKEKTVEVLSLLVKAGIKLRYIRGIRFSEVYSTFTGTYKTILTIETLKNEYSHLMLSNALSSLGYRIELTYHGEYSGDLNVPKNMWVKFTEAQREEYKKQKDPCNKCPLIERTPCTNDPAKCQAINLALNS